MSDAIGVLTKCRDGFVSEIVRLVSAGGGECLPSSSKCPGGLLVRFKGRELDPVPVPGGMSPVDEWHLADTSATIENTTMFLADRVGDDADVQIVRLAAELYTAGCIIFEVTRFLEEKQAATVTA